MTGPGPEGQYKKRVGSEWDGHHSEAEEETTIAGQGAGEMGTGSWGQAPKGEGAGRKVGHAGNSLKNSASRARGQAGQGEGRQGLQGRRNGGGEETNTFSNPRDHVASIKERKLVTDVPGTHSAEAS